MSEFLFMQDLLTGKVRVKVDEAEEVAPLARLTETKQIG